MSVRLCVSFFVGFVYLRDRTCLLVLGACLFGCVRARLYACAFACAFVC